MSQETKESAALTKAILSLRTAEEVRRFLRDLMTETELREFGNRYAAARMLTEGVSYPQIQKATGLSPTTIARVSAWLKNGKGGYRLVIDRAHHAPLS